MSIGRAKRFLLSEFGPDRLNGNGLARLLDRYNNWVDSSVADSDAVVEYIKKNGIDSRVRTQDLVDKRVHLAVFLYVYHGWNNSKLAKLFGGKNHASISNYLTIYEDICQDVNFLINTENERMLFEVDSGKAISHIHERRKKRIQIQNNWKGRHAIKGEVVVIYERNLGKVTAEKTRTKLATNRIINNLIEKHL